MLGLLPLLAALLPVISAAPTTPASPLLQPRAGPAAGTIITKCTEPNTIALTFDDGPYQYEPAILSALNAAGAKATFFVTGTLYNCIYSQQATLKAAYAAGHQIGSHTWSHKDLDSQSAASITTEMQKLETAFANILGVKPTYMRPPSGKTGGSVASTMKTLGYRIVTWDIDSNDWNKYTAAQSEAKFTAGSGHIALMHETIQTTSTQLVPWVLNWAKTQGYKMVTVAQCLGDADGAYTTPATKTSATSC
ncbi:chitin deacetylase-like protein [Tricladium varicosporioides]|nr:chitin deacetylase-like protein [Hymenoscyphus varicosporioides]